MATQEIITDIYWNMEFPPRQKAQIVRDEDARPVGLDRWKAVVMIGDNFNIIYPMTPYDEETMTVPYEAEGQPVTLLDLLTTIYDFYQEPLLQQDPNLLLRHHQPRQNKHLTKRIDGLLGRTYFLGLDQVDVSTYQLIHE